MEDLCSVELHSGPIEDLRKTKMLDASGFPASSEDPFFHPMRGSI